MKRLSLLLFILIALFSRVQLVAFSHSSSIKPQWLVKGEPQSKSPSYFFISANGQGFSIEAARQRCLASLVSRMEIEHGLTINSELDATSTYSQNTSRSGNRSNYSYSNVTEFYMNVKESNQNVKIKCKIIDEYWEKNNDGYSLYVLYAVVEPRYHSIGIKDDILVTAKYNAGYGFLSVIPGVGQYCKGSKVKGTLFLSTEIVAAGTFLLAQNNFNSYKNKIVEQPKFAQEYQEKADQWETVRNMSLGAAGAIYVWNLIDAFTAKGARRVIVKKGRNTLTSYEVMPYSNMQEAGLAFRIGF